MKRHIRTIPDQIQHERSAMQLKFPNAVTIGLLSLLMVLPVSAQDLFVQEEGGQRRLVMALDAGPVTVRESTHAIQAWRLHRVPQSQALAVTWTESDPDRGPTSWYAVSLDGQTFEAVTKTTYELALRYSPFDPMQSTPLVPTHLDATSGGNLWIVQYWTQGIEAYRDSIRGLGGKIHLFLHEHANVVEMTGQTAANVMRLPFVRWVGSFQPAYKLEELLLQEQTQGVAAEPVRRVNILTMERGLPQKEVVAARIRALGGNVPFMSAHTHLMNANLTLQQIADVARMDEVQWIDLWTEAGNDMDVARNFHGVAYVDTSFGYNGAGVRGEVQDGGTDIAHPEYLAPILHGGNTASDHGTATFGQIFSRGVANAQSRGMLPAGQGIVADYVSNGVSGGTGDRYTITGELVNNTYQAVFQSNSWGHSTTTSYNSFSQEMDTILFDHNLTICQSQSNTGNQFSRPEAWAKNVVSVGGVWHFDTLSEADDTYTSPAGGSCFGFNTTSASVGPAADGRIKPDLASFYDCIFTTDRVGAVGYTNNNYTTNFGGTSGATPIVAGSFGLFYQMWHNGIFGNSTSTSVFNSRPQNTTAKAFMIATATQWSTGVASRFQQGWGRPDLRNLYDQSGNIFFVNETDVLTNLQSKSYNVSVAGGSPLKVVLCYREPPGTVSSTQHSINNLDLTVTSPFGLVYRGNNGLSTSATSSSGGGADTKNNVECVFLNNPVAGVWQVTVRAASINTDNHVETAAVDADYALVVVGVESGPFHMIHRSSGGGVGDVTIGLRNIPAGTIQGYTLFSLQATGFPGSGSMYGLYPDSLTWACLFAPAVPGGLTHWTHPVNGIFPAVDVVLGPGSIPLPATTPGDGVGVALGLGGNGLTVLGVTPVARIFY